MGVMADCQNVVQKSIEELSGLDIIISNAVSYHQALDHNNIFDEVLRPMTEDNCNYHRGLPSSAPSVTYTPLRTKTGTR
jgi:hypothetical protein